MRIFLFLVIMMMSQSLYADNNHSNADKSWVIYLALDPYDASEISRVYHLGIDVSQYEYPLYVGYVYTLDSKNVMYKSFSPLVDDILKRWASKFPKNPCILPDMKGSRIEDKDFIVCASLQLQLMESFVVIMRGVGVTPDDKWRPVFSRMYKIDGDPDLTSTMMNDVKGVYSPLNKLPGHE